MPHQLDTSSATFETHKGEGLQRERIPRIGRQARRLRQPYLLAHDVRAQHHRDHLVLRTATAHAFASHPAIGGDNDRSGGMCFSASRTMSATWSLGPPYGGRRFRDRPVRPLRHFPTAAETDFFTRGTEGSNPACSSGESRANLTRV